MAAMKGYANILEDLEHKVTLSTDNGVEMKKIRVKAAKCIFSQCFKSGTVDYKDSFDPDTIDVSDIEERKQYYNGFTFVP